MPGRDRRQPQTSQRFPGLTLHVQGRMPLASQRKFHVCGDSSVKEEWTLRHQTDVPMVTCPLSSTDPLALEADFTFVRRGQKREQFKQRAFPRAVGAHQRGDAALGDRLRINGQNKTPLPPHFHVLERIKRRHSGRRSNKLSARFVSSATSSSSNPSASPSANSPLLVSSAIAVVMVRV